MLLAVSHVFYCMECVHFNGISSIYALFIVHVLHIKMHRVCFFFLFIFHHCVPHSLSHLTQSLALNALFSVFIFFFFIFYMLRKLHFMENHFSMALFCMQLAVYYIQDDHCLFTANDNLWAFCWSWSAHTTSSIIHLNTIRFLIFRHRCTTISIDFISFVRGERNIFSLALWFY